MRCEGRHHSRAACSRGTTGIRVTCRMSKRARQASSRFLVPQPISAVACWESTRRSCATSAKESTRLLNKPDTGQLRRFGGSHSKTAKRAFDQLAREGAKGLLVDVIDCVGAVEAMWSLAAATTEHGWCYPQPARALRAVGLFHPFLGRQGVPNDLQLDDQVRVCFLTGPNMAGKSTFLKAIAIAVAARARRLWRTGSIAGIPDGWNDLLQRPDRRQSERRRELLSGRSATDPRSRRCPSRSRFSDRHR